MKSVIFVLMLIMGILPSVSLAQDGYDTRSFIVDIRANEDNTFDVTETISVDFSRPQHGIFRDIPYIYGKTRIDNVEVEGEPFNIEKGGTNIQLVMRILIGEEDKELIGFKTYKITYTLVLLPDRIPDYDLLYLDLLPSYWNSSIDSARCTLTLPRNIDWKEVGYFSGKEGSESLSDKFRIEASGNQLVVTASNVDKHEGFTVRTLLPEGYWNIEGRGEMIDWFLIVLLILIVVVMVILWYLYGRDSSVVKTVEMYPPENLSPVDVYYRIGGCVEAKDFFSLITYFAHKGYLSIKEKENGRFILYRIVPKEDLEGEEIYVVNFFEFLFPDDEMEFDTGEKTRIAEKARDRAEILKKAISNMENIFAIRNDVYCKSSRNARKVGFSLLFLLLFVVYILVQVYVGERSLNAWWFLAPLIAWAGAFKFVVTFEQRRASGLFSKIIGYAIGAAAILLGFWGIYDMMETCYSLTYFPHICVSFGIALFFQMIMYSREKESAVMLGRLLGFKEFIRVAELDRIQTLVEKNPAYFYEILPYAYVFGLTDKWIKHFEKIDIGKPSWFRSNDTQLYLMSSTLALREILSSLDSLNSGMGLTYEKESASYGDGGGSVGGGSGGGGGGAW